MLERSEGRLPTGARFGSLLCWFVLFLSLPNLFFIAGGDGIVAVPYGQAEHKTAYLQQHAEQFDLLFIGDSRSYAGIDPDLMDHLLGSRSLNLAHWGHWFPTQYANFRELLPAIGPDTLVVWSIGHYNFLPLHEQILPRYPIPNRLVPTYLQWGFPFLRLQKNLATFLDRQLKYFPWLPVYQARQELLSWWRAVLARPISDSAGEMNLLLEQDSFNLPGVRLSELRIVRPTISNLERVEQLFQQTREDPEVMTFNVHVREAQIVAVSIYKKRGNYLFVEIEPIYFRRQQQETGATLAPLSTEIFEPAPEYWKNFEELLQLFQRYDINLVVNELQEAPYTYRYPQRREAYQAFMRRVQNRVEAAGFPYIRADFSRLSDWQYFDFDHLNSNGIAMYDRMLADLLRPYYQRKKVDALQ